MNTDSFSLLKNRSFALLTNATGRDQNLNSTLELMLHSGVRPSLLLEPEHGLYGHMDEKGKDNLRRESRYGIRILSLYSKDRKPHKRHLRNINTIVVDIQNLAVRCYTYISTLTYLMETAEEQGIELMILDRPNLYGVWDAQGSIIEKGYESFVGLAPVPFLYSLTIAEYARYMVDLRFPRLYLEIVPVHGYKRKDLKVGMKHSWVNPSPNIPSLETALMYPGLVFFEGVNYSLGRGTTRPFVYSGAPWLKSLQVVEELRALELKGIKITETIFTPTYSKYQGKTNYGVMIVPDKIQFNPIQAGYEYMQIVRRLHSKHFKFVRSKDGRYFIDKLWGGPGYRLSLIGNLSYEEFRSTWLKDAQNFEKLIQNYRLY